MNFRFRYIVWGFIDSSWIHLIYSKWRKLLSWKYTCRTTSQYFIFIHQVIMWITSPLSLRRDSFITPDIKDFFSVLTLNFAFLPRKLMVSHGQGFCSLCPAFVVFCQHFCSWHYKILLTVWTVGWWRGFSLKMVITGYRHFPYPTQLVSLWMSVDINNEANSSHFHDWFFCT